jgi:hypothetical protein
MGWASLAPYMYNFTIGLLSGVKPNLNYKLNNSKKFLNKSLQIGTGEDRFMYVYSCPIGNGFYLFMDLAI